MTKIKKKKTLILLAILIFLMVLLSLLIVSKIKQNNYSIKTSTEYNLEDLKEIKISKSFIGKPSQTARFVYSQLPAVFMNSKSFFYVDDSSSNIGYYHISPTKEGLDSIIEQIGDKNLEGLNKEYFANTEVESSNYSIIKLEWVMADGSEFTFSFDETLITSQLKENGNNQDIAIGFYKSIVDLIRNSDKEYFFTDKIKLNVTKLNVDTDYPNAEFIDVELDDNMKIIEDANYELQRKIKDSKIFYNSRNEVIFVNYIPIID
jgi:hypothetical protein